MIQVFQTSRPLKSAMRWLSGARPPRTIGVVFFGLVFSALMCGQLSAAPVGADAVVLVNSASARYLDFRNYIHPYLDHFGLPYSVVDIRTNPVGADVGNHALLIVGHSLLDSNHVYLDTTEQNYLTLAVSNGTGLVNFDSILSDGGVTGNYPYVQSIFDFSYTNTTTGTSVMFLATEPSGQMHYVTARHTNGEIISLRASQALAGIVLPTNVTAVAWSGGRPLVAVKKFGQGRAVQWAGTGWMATSVKGPLGGLDDLVWRSLVWAARKPLVMRGMPNFVTMRLDDVSGPKPVSASGLSWIQDAVDAGYKPWLGLFFGCLDPAEVGEIRAWVTNGSATASIHSWGCIGSSGGRNWFLWDHFGAADWPGAQMTNDFLRGLLWHQTNGIPISKVVAPHYSEIGINAFGGLKSWGVEFLTIKNYPGTLRDSPWLVAGPYRRYEPQQPGSVLLPLFYADFLTVSGHPEFDGQFFNCVTEIRDDAACGEWCPDDDVAASIGRGTRQLKRAFDSLVMGTLFTHEFYVHPTTDQSSYPAISSANWRAILQGITNNIAGYQPQYVTMDYACQYVRATRTAQIMTAEFDPATGLASVALTGWADVSMSVQVFVGADSDITAITVPVPAFTNSAFATVQAAPAPPWLRAYIQSNQFLLDFPAATGRSYTIHYADTFGSWLPLTNFIAQTTNVTFTDPILSPQRFYRVSTPAD